MEVCTFVEMVKKVLKYWKVLGDDKNNIVINAEILEQSNGVNLQLA